MLINFYLQSTGGSTGEDDELLSFSSETIRTTQFNEGVSKRMPLSYADHKPQRKQSNSVIKTVRLRYFYIKKDVFQLKNDMIIIAQVTSKLMMKIIKIMIHSQ